jgi:hypothetical protein
MKLILTLLAILTGLVGGDAARHAPAPTAALGVAAVLVHGGAEQAQRLAAHRPLADQPRRLAAACLQAVRAVGTAPILSGLTPRGLRARE